MLLLLLAGTVEWMTRVNHLPGGASLEEFVAPVEGYSQIATSEVGETLSGFGLGFAITLAPATGGDMGAQACSSIASR